MKKNTMLKQVMHDPERLEILCNVLYRLSEKENGRYIAEGEKSETPEQTARRVGFFDGIKSVINFLDT